MWVFSPFLLKCEQKCILKKPAVAPYKISSSLGRGKRQDNLVEVNIFFKDCQVGEGKHTSIF